MKTTELVVKGMSCHHCETAVKNAFENIGIKEVTISQISGEKKGEVFVEFNEQSMPPDVKNVRIVSVSHELNDQAIIDCIEELGYEVTQKI